MDGPVTAPPRPDQGSPDLPASSGFLGRVERFDACVDRAFDHLRGKAAFDRAAVVASNLADYGFVWALLAALKGRRAGPARQRARRALALAGTSSAATNAAIKALVGRQRPDGALRIGEGPATLRAPRSSSFPSGHTLAAFCTALLLADTPTETASYLGFATAVAASRVHLKAHHASDVVGGGLIGVALGMSVRKLWKRGTAAGMSRATARLPRG
jgi:membrane-associated phospholipid phosphatase